MSVAEELRAVNQAAYEDPRQGDYWHEMGTPYFCVLDRRGDELLVDVGFRKWEGFPVIRISLKHLQTTVRYRFVDGFVADVSRKENRITEETKTKLSSLWEEAADWTKPRGKVELGYDFFVFADKATFLSHFASSTEAAPELPINIQWPITTWKRRGGYKVLSIDQAFSDVVLADIEHVLYQVQSDPSAKDQQLY